jgi:putative ABC transport system permease protein
MVDREMPRRYRMARAVTTAAKAPEGLRVVEGKWWDTEDGPAQISITQGAARSLRVRPGSTLTWSAFGKTIETKVAAIHRMDSERLRAMVEFVVSPGVLDGLPTVYYAAARMKTAEISSLQRETYKRFPTVTVVNIAEVVSRVQEIVNQIAVVIRFISAFAIFAGAIILSSSIAGTRYRRTREVVIFKTLGATRGRIARMFSAEFLILGTVAGLMGSGLATLFSSLLLSRFFEAQLRVDWVPNVVAIAGTALIAAASGWLASFRILGQSPLEVLRAE